MFVLLAYLANAKKAIIQVLTLVLALLTYILTLHVLSKQDAAFCTAAVGFIGTVLHYFTSNAEAPGDGEATEELDAASTTDGEYDEDETPDPDTVPDGPVTSTQAGSVDDSAAVPATT